MAAPTQPGGLAALWLALALAAAALSFYAGDRAAREQGPTEFALLDAKRAWIVLNDEVLEVDSEGRLQRRFSRAQLGVDAPIVTIARLPDGAALLGTRSLRWPVVEPASGRVLRSIEPSAELASAIRRGSYHLAVAGDGSLAIGAGGMHRVYLLDHQGRLRARSAEGLFRYANGLWFGSDGLWAADTNHHQLRRLDPATLAEQRSIQLSWPRDRRAFTGNAVPFGGEGADRFATLIRLNLPAFDGRVVDIDATGKEVLVYALGDAAEPSAIAWWSNRLIVADTAAYALRRFLPTGEELVPLGDEALLAALARPKAERRFWSQVRLGALAAAGVLLALGLWSYLRGRYGPALRENGPDDARRPVVGTPWRPRRQLWTYSLRQTWAPWLFILLPPAVLPWLIRVLPADMRGLGSTRIALWLLIATSILIGLAWLFRRVGRLYAQPDAEAFVNAHALALLRRPGRWRDLLAPDESPREVLVLTRGALAAGMRILMLTNRRVLVFGGQVFDASLVAEHRLRHLTGAHLAPAQGRLAPLLDLLRFRGWTLRLTFADGGTVEGVTRSFVTARRIMALLHDRAAARAVGHSPVTAPPSIASAVPGPRAAPVFASLLLPGLGQMMQDRTLTGMLLLTGAGLVAAFTLAPALYYGLGSRTDISANTVAYVLIGYAVIVLIAVLDAWVYERGRRRRAA
jgi:hypothetical protein